MRQLPPVTPRVVDRAVFLDEIDVARDGRTAYVVRRTTDGLDYRRELWTVPLDGGSSRDGGSPLGGSPRRLTFGPADTHPRVSPDGASLAFLSRRPVSDPAGSTAKAVDASSGRRPATAPAEPKTQVWVLPLGGGGPWRLTREASDVVFRRDRPCRLDGGDAPSVVSVSLLDASLSHGRRGGQTGSTSKPSWHGTPSPGNLRNRPDGIR